MLLTREHVQRIVNEKGDVFAQRNFLNTLRAMSDSVGPSAPLGAAEQTRRPCRQCAALTLLHDYLTTSDRSNAGFLRFMSTRL
jgi:hypothetical protein